MPVAVTSPVASSMVSPVSASSRPLACIRRPRSSSSSLRNSLVSIVLNSLSLGVGARGGQTPFSLVGAHSGQGDDLVPRAVAGNDLHLGRRHVERGRKEPHERVARP